MDADADFSIPGWFIAFFVIMVLLGVAATIWRVTAARNMARDAGLDPKRATQVSLLGDDGLGAAYLASTLASKPTAAPSDKTVEQRLHELESLRTRGLVSEAEYTAQRQRIIDSV